MSGGKQYRALNAVSATGASTALHLGLPMAIHSMQVVHTGGPTVVVKLEGSIDGTNFLPLVTWDNGVQTNGDIVTASAFAGTDVRAYPAVSWVRANVTSFSGGSSPTVTAWIASC